MPPTVNLVALPLSTHRSYASRIECPVCNISDRTQMTFEERGEL